LGAGWREGNDADPAAPMSERQQAAAFEYILVVHRSLDATTRDGVKARRPGWDGESVLYGDASHGRPERVPGWPAPRPLPAAAPPPRATYRVAPRRHSAGLVEHHVGQPADAAVFDPKRARHLPLTRSPSTHRGRVLSLNYAGIWSSVSSTCQA
jgi:hypothetical protein